MTQASAVDVVMPQMGVSVSEGTVTKWLKAPGEAVAADEPLLEISTDKVDSEVPSPADGVLTEILVQEGETVDVGTRIGVISPGGTPGAGASPSPAAAPAAPAAVSPADAPAPADIPTAARAAATPTASGPVASDPAGERAFVSPVVARIAAEHGIDVGRVPGTGRGGRVTKNDILAYLETMGTPSTIAPTPAPAVAPAPARAEPVPAAVATGQPTPAPVPATTAPTGPAAAPAPGEQLERMSVMRRSIAQHMRESVETHAPVTTVFEIDMSKVWAIRERLKREYETQHGVKLTFLAFIARAAIDALASWPWLNGTIRDDQIVTRGFVNLGIAVALDDGKGLIVPSIRNAEEKNLLGIARAVQDLADRARAKRLSPDEVQGVTFTITNPGGFGAIMGTPIIPVGTAAIMDVEAIVKRPVVISDDTGTDAIAIRPMMNLCLTYDHRLIDGAYAAPFMRDVRRNLETWDEGQY